MTLCYQLFGRPGTIYEFLDKAEQTGARAITIYAYLDEGMRSSVDITTDTDRRPFTLRHRQAGQLKCGLNKQRVDVCTLNTLVKFANRLRARGYTVNINDKPIGYAEEILTQLNETLDRVLQSNFALTSAERAQASALPSCDLERYLAACLKRRLDESSPFTS
ncbi:MAG TPA: hypothetical protein VJH37_03655 [Candidatus Nanoarchaeia archaeon]|nr:hypothetical protein [Candidatus Nanoarchaeia archaeon]